MSRVGQHSPMYNPPSDVPATFAENIDVQRKHECHDGDVVCLVKQRISSDKVQALIVAPHNILLRLPSVVPTVLDKRKAAGKQGKKWITFANKFMEQNPHPEYARASRYLTALANGTIATGKRPTPMVWHEAAAPDNLRGALVPDLPDLAQSIPLRARWR